MNRSGFPGVELPLNRSEFPGGVGVTGAVHRFVPNCGLIRS